MGDSHAPHQVSRRGFPGLGGSFAGSCRGTHGAEAPPPLRLRCSLPTTLRRRSPLPPPSPSQAPAGERTALLVPPRRWRGHAHPAGRGPPHTWATRARHRRNPAGVEHTRRWQILPPGAACEPHARGTRKTRTPPLRRAENRRLRLAVAHAGSVSWTCCGRCITACYAPRNAIR